ncbi:MAG: hypothetical protein ACRD3S_09945 [Terracidiphilus sp.]
MLGLTDARANNAPMPSVALPTLHLAAELDRRDVEARLEAMHVRIHKERRAEFYHNLLALWPVVLGLGLSCCATMLRDAAAGYAPLLAKFLFPLAALAAFHDVRFGPNAMPTLSQVMLYGQFALDGLLALMLLRQRSAFLTVCVQVVLFHVLFLLSIGCVAGSFSALTMN